MGPLLNRRGGPLLLTAALVICLAPLAEADPPPTIAAEGLTNKERIERARAEFRIGQAHFRRGRFVEAMEAFANGYELHALPLFLYNQAMSARRAGKLELALAAYRRFIAIVPEAVERPEVELRISEIENALHAEAPEPEVVPGDAPAAPPRPAGTDAQGSPASPRDATTPPAEAGTTASLAVDLDRRGPSRRAKQALGGAMMGLGAVSLGIGGGLAGLAAAAGRALNDPVAGTVYDPTVETRRDRLQAAGLTLIVVGGTALVAGSVWLGLGLRDRVAPRSRTHATALVTGSVQ